MKTAHVLILVAAVAFAAVAGTYAAMRTTHLSVASAQPARVGSAAIARQNRALDRARKPPALPRVPAPAPVSAPAVSVSAPAAAAAPPVIYVRPKPIVHVIHRHGEGEREHEGGDRAAGGSLDD
jgi:hypothetical protein